MSKRIGAIRGRCANCGIGEVHGCPGPNLPWLRELESWAGVTGPLEVAEDWYLEREALRAPIQRLVEQVAAKDDAK